MVNKIKKNKQFIILAILVIFGIFLRMFLYKYGMEKGNINGLTGGYLSEADSILSSSQWFYDNIAGKMILNTNHPKGYAFLIAFLKILTNDNWLYAMHWLNAIVDSFTAILIFKICHHAFKNDNVGYVAAFIYTICPLTIINSVQELPDAFAPFLLALLIYNWVKPSEKLFKKYLVIGLCLGLCGYFRAELIYIIFILIIVDLLNNYNLKIFIQKALILIVTLQIMMAPWGLYTYSQTGKYITGSTSAWGSAYEALGQNPNVKWDIELNDIWLNQDALENGYYGAFNYEANDYYKGQCIEYVKTYPGNYIETVVKYRLMNAFFPKTYAIANLDRSLSEMADSYKFCEANFSTSLDKTLCYKTDKFVKLTEGLYARIISIFFVVTMIIFMIMNLKKWKEYSWIVLIWLYFPCAIALLKQIEPRNVAPNLVVLIIACGFVIVKLFEIIINKVKMLRTAK